MSDIRVGDMVMVVRASCQHEKNLGFVFQVTELRHDCSHCTACYKFTPHQWHATNPRDPATGWPFSCLKKLPPLDELDDVKHDEEITA